MARMPRIRFDALDAMIWDEAPGHKSVPDEKNNYRADSCPNNSGKSVRRIIQAGRVTYISCKERPSDAKRGGEDKTLWRVRTRHEQTRNGAGNKPD
jgi:hypothetical protein